MALEGWKRRMDDWLRKCNDRLSLDKILHPFAGMPGLAPLTEQAVLDFEREHGIRLPEEYRQYLLTVSNGLASGYSLQESLNPDEISTPNFLSTTFPHREEWNPVDSDIPVEVYDSPRQVAGSLLLFHEGCSHFTRLVVTGPEAGFVWDDSRGSGGICPFQDEKGQRLTFNAWLLQNRWMLMSTSVQANLDRFLRQPGS